MNYVEISNNGKSRTVNQDSIFAGCHNDAGLFVVADGMGGHSHGEWASRYITEKLCEWWQNFVPEKFGRDFKKMVLALNELLEQINREIYYQFNKEEICGSTVVLLFLYQNYYGIIYAGDSRAYLLQGRKFCQLTTDEVWENQPNLSETEKRERWGSCHGKLLNAVGIRKELQCRLFTNQTKKNAIFLLCSDGLYKDCPERCIKKYMEKARKPRNMQRSGDALLDVVLNGSAKDNVSFILVNL